MNYKEYYNKALKELSSPENYGRSAFNDGDIRAARIIMDRILHIKDLNPTGQSDPSDQRAVHPPFKSEVLPYTEGRYASISDKQKYTPFLQNFRIPMNVFRGDMDVTLGDKRLCPTLDFTVKEFSPTCHGTFKVKEVDDKAVTSEDFVKELSSGKYTGCFAIVSWQKYLTLNAEPLERYRPYLGKLSKENVAGVIFKDADLFPYFKARSYYSLDIPVLMMTEDALKDSPDSITVDIDAQMLEEHDCHNIIAYLAGNDPQEKQYYTFIAHYDHLGLMGRDNCFPGANDNASGAAMLLALAEYFSKNRPSHGIQFIWLDAEEENLLGSFYYCANPVMPLDRIKLCINLDMIADNTDHLATECSENGKGELSRIKEINSDNGAFSPFEFALQKLSDISDHYSFSESGVPSVYFSTEGDYYRHYHTPRDTYQNCTDDNFERLFAILTKYID